MATLWGGNRPANVNKDAKYTVKLDGTIQLTYRLSDEDKALLTATEHPELAERVNDVKDEHGFTRGGPFYIDEYRNVLVPAGDDGTYYNAGKYDQDLQFTFEGSTIGPVPPDGLEPGEVWKGPHVGIPYVLAAGANDIYYEFESRPQVITRRKLSKTAGKQSAAALARRLAGVKGDRGGRVYINERRHFLAPVEVDHEWQYLYLGALGEDPWFAEP